jgi:two-component system, LuxR family, response regulator FixJ
MDKEPTVFILDDDSAVRQALTLSIRSMQLRVEAFESSEQFLGCFDRDQPGCLLLDVRMPGISGLEVLDRFRRENICLPTVVISAFGDVPTVVRAMRAGALNFLEKPWREQQLWEAIHEAVSWDATHRRQLTARAKVLRRLERLTPGERSVLRSLLDGRSNKSIAEQLDLSVRTIEVRRAKVMKKMKADSLARLIRLTLEADANFDDQPPDVAQDGAR